MAITLRLLCEKASYLYGMRVLAGNEGMSNIVQWVHTVEDVEVSGFLHGGELIFSTGIANKSQDWLMPFVKNLIDKQVSGLVVNIGPYIKTVPKEVIDYCNAMNFPLLDIPWKTRIVDITRDFCNTIILNEKKEEDIGETLKNLIFFPNEAEKYSPVLERHDFDVNADFCVVAVHTVMQGNTPFDKAKLFFDRFLYSTKKHCGCFNIDNTLYYVLCDFSEEEIENVVSNFQAQQYHNLQISRVYVGVGASRCRLPRLYKNYQIASKLIALGQKNSISPIYYDKLGVKRLILSVDNNEVLKSFYNEHLRKLELYDRENGTDYMSFLRKYLENDGSVQRVAEETFVHRNTINYQLVKIKKILGNDMKTLEDRLNIMLAFYIKTLL